MTTAGPRQAIIAHKLLSCGAPERSGAYGEWLRVPQSDAQRGRLGSTAAIDSTMATACSMPLRTPMPPFSFRPVNEPASRESHMGSGGGWLTSVEEV